MDASRELHQVPARRGSQLLARSALITRSNSNQVPIRSRVVHHAGAWIQGTASSPGPQGIAAATRLGVDRFADVRSCWPWDPSRELHRVPARRGLHYAGPVGVDHSRELLTGPEGIAAAGPVGVDRSIELQPGPHGIQGCASSRRSLPGSEKFSGI
jgi:hypothetical protein